MNIYDARRHNLSLLIIQYADGVMARFADLVDYAPAYISQLLTDPNKKGARNIGERTARKIESVLKLPHGHMDTGYRMSVAPSPPTALPTPAAHIKVDRLTHRIKEANLKQKDLDLLMSVINLFIKTKGRLPTAEGG